MNAGLIGDLNVMFAQSSRDPGRRLAKPIERFEGHQAMGDFTQDMCRDQARQVLVLDALQELGPPRAVNLTCIGPPRHWRVFCRKRDRFYAVTRRCRRAKGFSVKSR